MAATFPTSPVDGEYASVNGITYVYASAKRSWTRVPGGGGGGGGTPGGTDQQVQYNAAGSFAASAGLTFNYTTNALATTGTFSATGNIAGGNFTTSGNVVATGGNVAGGNIAAVTTIFSFGTIQGTGNVSGGNLTTTGQVTATGNITGGGHVGTIYTNSIINTGSNATGNIGSSSLYFNTVFAKATSAQYADVAEWYSSDAEYEPGTVVVFDGSAEVTISTTNGDDKVAGVVSTNPAYIMNAGIQSEYAVPVALTGRVPTKVIGPVKKGNMMISAGNGYAQACATPAIGTVIGKALENFDKQKGIIEIVVGRI